MTPHLSIQDGNPMCQECGRNCNKHPRQWFAKQTDDDCNSISLAPKMSNKSKNATWTCPQWRSSAVEIAPPSHPNPLLDRGRSQQTSCFDISSPIPEFLTHFLRMDAEAFSPRQAKLYVDQRRVIWWVGASMIVSWGPDLSLDHGRVRLESYLARLSL